MARYYQVSIEEMKVAVI